MEGGVWDWEEALYICSISRVAVMYRDSKCRFWTRLPEFKS